MSIYYSPYTAPIERTYEVYEEPTPDGSLVLLLSLVNIGTLLLVRIYGEVSGQGAGLAEGYVNQQIQRVLDNLVLRVHNAASVNKVVSRSGKGEVNGRDVLAVAVKVADIVSGEPWRSGRERVERWITYLRSLSEVSTVVRDNVWRLRVSLDNDIDNDGILQDWDRHLGDDGVRNLLRLPQTVGYSLMRHLYGQVEEMFTWVTPVQLLEGRRLGPYDGLQKTIWKMLNFLNPRRQRTLMRDSYNIATYQKLYKELNNTDTDYDYVYDDYKEYDDATDENYRSDYDDNQKLTYTSYSYNKKTAQPNSYYRQNVDIENIYNKDRGTYNRDPGAYNTREREPETYNIRDRHAVTNNRRTETYKTDPGTYKRDPGTYKRDPEAYKRDPGTYKRDPGTYKRDPTSNYYNQGRPAVMYETDWGDRLYGLVTRLAPVVTDVYNAYSKSRRYPHCLRTIMCEVNKDWKRHGGTAAMTATFLSILASWWLQNTTPVQETILAVRSGWMGHHCGGVGGCTVRRVDTGPEGHGFPAPYTVWQETFKQPWPEKQYVFSNGPQRIRQYITTTTTPIITTTTPTTTTTTPTTTTTTPTTTTTTPTTTTTTPTTTTTTPTTSTTTTTTPPPAFRRGLIPGSVAPMSAAMVQSHPSLVHFPSRWHQNVYSTTRPWWTTTTTKAWKFNVEDAVKDITKNEILYRYPSERDRSWSGGVTFIH